ncbi:MAG: Asp-tRNA(Asn)/Glu-tRNA(Gln) amidotransferase subunit GatA [Terriglobales bacterium]
MMATDTISEHRTRLAERQLTAEQALDRSMAMIAAGDDKIHAFLTLCPERARAHAKQMDAMADRGEPLPPLAGVPVAIKDVLSTRGVRTTCGSRVLANYVPEYDATVVQRLEAAGALIVGKTNCDEFAMGSTTENSAYGPTRNPRDLSRVPGGSSGGSAAAVAANFVVGALGTDTGGSIRQPAAFCGIVGLLPTYGRVSRLGLAAFASSLDRVGPMGRTAKDVAHLLHVIAGRDELDATSAAHPVPDYVAALEEPISGLRIGVPREVFNAGLDAGVEAAVRAAVEQLREAGCTIRETSMPRNEDAIAVYYILAPAEASSNLARYDGVRYGVRAGGSESLAAMYRRTRDAGFGAEVKRRILLGTYVLSAGYYDAYYRKAQQVRALLRQDFERAFADYDLILTPTTPTVALPLGKKITSPVETYLNDIYTVPASLAGLPAISFPCGTSEGLPVGLQLIAPAFAEARLLRVAHQYERIVG